jgi:hypothetical protein
LTTFTTPLKIDDPAITSFLLLFMIPMILMTLLPYYFSTNLTLASEKLSTSLFHSNWLNESPKFKSTMKIVTEMSKRKIAVRSFGAYEVNLEKFLLIMNSAWSMYAVLKNI